MDGRGEILIETRSEGGEVMVAIEDSGPGIPTDAVPRIFEPFFTTKAKGEGTGLGLSICAKIVEKHGGSIRVDSQPGRTRFEVRLPIDGPPMVRPLEDLDRTTPSTAAHTAPLRLATPELSAASTLKESGNDSADERSDERSKERAN